jgi:hypothetical protein
MESGAEPVGGVAHSSADWLFGLMDALRQNVEAKFRCSIA